MTARKRANAPVGLGRVSTSLGAADPRIRRNAQMAQAPSLSLNQTMRIDSLGRHGVRPVRRVRALETESVQTPGSDTDTVGRISEAEERIAAAEAKVNEILAALVSGGLMEGGR